MKCKICGAKIIFDEAQQLCFGCWVGDEGDSWEW